MFLYRVAQAVKRANARISAPGKNQLRGAAHADQLVVDQVRRHTNQRQIAPLLPDNFVPRGEGNQVGESLERNRVAVVHELRNGLFEFQDNCQTDPPLIQRLQKRVSDSLEYARRHDHGLQKQGFAVRFMTRFCASGSVFYKPVRLMFT